MTLVQPGLFGLAAPKKTPPRSKRRPKVAAPAPARPAHSTGVDRLGRRTWTVQIPAPADWLSSNDRLHKQAEAKIVKLWRGAGAVYAMQAKLPKGLERVHVLARCHFTMVRKRDAGNRYPTAKAAVDGLVDYGLMADDNDDLLLGPDMRRGPNVDRKTYPGGGLLTLVITELGPDDDDSEATA